MPIASPTARLKGTIPFLACEDILATVEFYMTRLGFVQDWIWGDTPDDAGLSRDGVCIYLARNPELAARAGGSEFVVLVDDVDALYAEHQARGAPIVAPLADKPWGTREYTVRDPAGYCLRFTGDPEVAE